MSNIHRRYVLKIAGAGATLLSRPGRLPAAVAVKSRPNIVWIYCDELRTEALGCYGHPRLKLHTPNLDRVAAFHGLDRMNPELLRKARQCYYALAAWVDSQVGRVLDFLEKRGQLENTVIVFGADHGTPVGDTGAFEKCVFAPCVHRVPFIVSHPDGIKGGQARGDICDSLDLARTLFARAGIAAPDSFKGRDLFTAPAPDAIFATIGFGEPESQRGGNRGGRWIGGRGWPRRSCVRTARPSRGHQFCAVAGRTGPGVEKGGLQPVSARQGDGVFHAHRPLAIHRVEESKRFGGSQRALRSPEGSSGKSLSRDTPRIRHDRQGARRPAQGGLAGGPPGMMTPSLMQPRAM